MGKEAWIRQLRKVYVKMANFKDGKVKKTLACSIHEVAKLVGSPYAETDLLPILEKFLNSSTNDLKHSALKNLHIFLAQIPPSMRPSLLKSLL